MGFVDRLPAHPVLVEVIPPKAGASPAQVDQALRLVGDVLDQCKADAVNVPEIIGSAFQGMDPLEFGLRVRKEFGVDVVVNKVTVHEPREAFEAWIDRVLASDLASTILVGGERGGIYYPGPSVLEADRVTRERAEAAGRPRFPVGNVTLPARAREALRMLDKVKAGCDYFTSQIIYEPVSPNAHLQAYDDVCALTRTEPRPVLYAFSPAETKQDILFLRYLGVNIPPEAERAILAAPGDGGATSLRMIHDIWTRLLGMAQEREVAVPLGIVAETVSRHNTDAVAALVRGLREGLASAAAKPLAGATQRVP